MMSSKVVGFAFLLFLIFAVTQGWLGREAQRQSRSYLGMDEVATATDHAKYRPGECLIRVQECEDWDPFWRCYDAFEIVEVGYKKYLYNYIVPGEPIDGERGDRFINWIDDDDNFRVMDCGALREALEAVSNGAKSP